MEGHESAMKLIHALPVLVWNFLASNPHQVLINYRIGLFSDGMFAHLCNSNSMSFCPQRAWGIALRIEIAWSIAQCGSQAIFAWSKLAAGLLSYHGHELQ
eukprot:6349265-Amphidinium_carterae.2